MRVQRLDVAVTGHVGPVASEDAVAIRIILHLPANHHAGALQPKVEAANAAEQGANGECHSARGFGCSSDTRHQSFAFEHLADSLLVLSACKPEHLLNLAGLGVKLDDGRLAAGTLIELHAIAASGVLLRHQGVHNAIAI